jgi:hypothetical protein
VDSFGRDYIKRSICCQFGSFPIRPIWVKPNPLSYFQSVAERAVEADMHDAVYGRQERQIDPAI